MWEGTLVRCCICCSTTALFALLSVRPWTVVGSLYLLFDHSCLLSSLSVLFWQLLSTVGGHAEVVAVVSYSGLSLSVLLSGCFLIKGWPKGRNKCIYPNTLYLSTREIMLAAPLRPPTGPHSALHGRESRAGRGHYLLFSKITAKGTGLEVSAGVTDSLPGPQLSMAELAEACSRACYAPPPRGSAGNAMSQ
jgi:hypothetical protein